MKAGDRRRTLLVAGTGGHLSELAELQGRLPALQQAPLWFVPDSEQSSGLLRGQEIVPAPEVAPRDLRHVPVATLAVQRLLRRYDVDCVVSTGAGVAVAAFAAARAHGIACHYIESAARVQAPSLTGHLVRALPGVHLWSQHAWDRPGPWQLAPSVFDGYRPARRPEGAAHPRVLVMVGTMRFGFTRLLEAVRASVPPGSTVVWQTGATDVSGLGIEARPWMTPVELSEAVLSADVVISHAGAGSALTALAGGASPILVPRRRQHGEHVDDHQSQLAHALAQRGLVQAVEADELRPHHLYEAARRAVEQVTGPLDDVSLQRSRRRW